METEFKTPVKVTKKVLKIPPSPFLKKIGFGTGIGVYEFQRSPSGNKLNSPWAIKKLLKGVKDKTYSSRLIKEAEVLKTLNHPNIVGFRAVLKSKGQNVLAMEECTSCLGELIEELRENNGDIYPVGKVLRVGEDISKALNYLHNVALILHCDIKSFNILIKKDFEIAKLCDFGTCLPLTKVGLVDKNKAGNNYEYIGTVLWQPPEVSEEPPIITSKADIYSFGLVIYEMITLAVPFADQIDNIDESFDSDISEDISLRVPEKTLTIPEDLKLDEDYNVILEIVGACTLKNYILRPTPATLEGVFQTLAKCYVQ